MFSRFFNMQENPFGETPNLRYFFMSRTHVAAVHALANMVRTGKGFGLVVGEVGTGKTLLCRLLLKLFEEEEGAATALILQPILEGRELLCQINDEFGVARPESQRPTLKDELDRLNEHLVRTAHNGQRSVLVIDEAHRLSFEALETVRLLTNLETETRKLVQVILLAQPELESKLQAHHMRQLSQRLSSSALLKPLDVEETERYIRHRIEIVGADNFVRFKPDAIRFLHKKSKGLPRLINFHAELALMSAETAQKRLIDQALLKTALRRKDGAGKRGLFGLFSGTDGDV